MTDFRHRLDQALTARGMSANAASRAAGRPGIIQNWKGKGQSPTLESLGDVSKAIHVDPAWLAFGDDPVPVAPPNGFHATPEKLDQPDNVLGAIYAAWKADDGQLEARFFDALEMTGLTDWTYILTEKDGHLVYDYIGPGPIKTLGFAWWITAHGKRVSEDPDPAFSGWCLDRYDTAMRREQPLRDDCLVVSRYTATTKGWQYPNLLLPIPGGVISISEVKS